jgi:hypothetical protein
VVAGTDTILERFRIRFYQLYALARVSWSGLKLLDLVCNGNYIISSIAVFFGIVFSSYNVLVLIYFLYI